MMLGLAIALRAGGMEPIPLPNSLQFGVSIYPSSKIEPVLMDDLNRLPDAILVTYEEFLAMVKRFKDKLPKGTIIPTSEGEIPELMYIEALS